jgi:hypothetical protein
MGPDRKGAESDAPGAYVEPPVMFSGESGIDCARPSAVLVSLPALRPAQLDSVQLESNPRWTTIHT